MVEDNAEKMKVHDNQELKDLISKERQWIDSPEYNSASIKEIKARIESEGKKLTELI